MQRPIKFRAWDSIAGMKYSSEYDRLQLFWNYANNRDLVQGFELMQYTGLHDKNGKEIYEGDIVRVSKRNPLLLQVVWRDDRGKYQLLYITPPQDYVDPIIRATRYEVIGNIYSNKELIDG